MRKRMGRQSPDDYLFQTLPSFGDAPRSTLNIHMVRNGSMGRSKVVDALAFALEHRPRSKLDKPVGFFQSAHLLLASDLYVIVLTAPSCLQPQELNWQHIAEGRAFIAATDIHGACGLGTDFGIGEDKRRNVVSLLLLRRDMTIILNGALRLHPYLAPMTAW